MPELSPHHDSSTVRTAAPLTGDSRQSGQNGHDGPAPDDREPQELIENATGVAVESEAAKSERTAREPVKKPREGESWVETVKTIVYALLIALVIRTFLFQPFNIPSGSMENTLLIGDYLFVEKYAYGYSKHSFPFSNTFPLSRLPSGRVLAAQPRRGDVIVFKFPPDKSTDYIKRVIGIPGDKVQMINGQLWLNDKAIPKLPAADYVETDEYGVVRHIKRYRETLPGGKSYYVLDRMENGPGDNTQPYVVPAGHYFMMGDNRDNSADSRLEVGGFGFVPAENLEGKAEFIFFSEDGSAALWEIWKWPWAIRYSRMFTVID